MLGAVKCNIGVGNVPSSWSTVWHIIWKQLMGLTEHASALLEVTWKICRVLFASCLMSQHM